MGWSTAKEAMRGWAYRSGMQSDRISILNAVWEREAGGLSRHWQLSGVKKGFIFVKTSSPAATQELQLRSAALLRGLNKHFKTAWIKGIKPAR